MTSLPHKAIGAAMGSLAGLSWFMCRHCRGLFVLGARDQVDVSEEGRQCRRHEARCADGPTYPAAFRIRLMLVMGDGSDYEVQLSPYLPAGAATLRFVELQGPAGEVIARWPLHKIEVVEG